MPVRRVGVRYVRVKFAPRDYTVPSDLIPSLRRYNADYGSRDLLANTYEGPFSGLARVREVSHGGKTYVQLYKAGAKEWAIEVELTDNKLGDIRALPPEEAWNIAREFDAKKGIPVED